MENIQKVSENIEREEKQLYKKARKKDAGLYILILLIIVIGFSSTELFSMASLIPCGVLFLWALGIARFGQKQTFYLKEAEPVVNRLVQEGLSEHVAMKKVGIDKFYYKPFWAIR